MAHLLNDDPRHRLSWCSGKIPRCLRGFAPKSFGWSPYWNVSLAGYIMPYYAIYAPMFGPLISQPYPQKIASFIPTNPNHMGSIHIISPTMNHNGIMGTQYPNHIPIAPFNPDFSPIPVSARRRSIRIPRLAPRAPIPVIWQPDRDPGWYPVAELMDVYSCLFPQITILFPRINTNIY